MHTNRLAGEASPYLLQHAQNPVDWFPWGEEAFQKARVQDKPIFLSIGYSTCHWCHVMERESFESEQIAGLLNRDFISIKVDREERPDVDAVYMSVLQAMTGSGGWPMSLFLTPELRPFFAGTYFPPVPAHGRPSFPELLLRIGTLWKEERNALIESSLQIMSMLNDRHQIVSNDDSIDMKSLIDKTYRFFEQSFDEVEGGFGNAPKFPRPVQFDFLFHYFYAFAKSNGRDMALATLRKMAMGGMHDHLGGGFHRYSVDRYWRISHFEKMLYDQAQLVHSYLDAWQITHDTFFREVVVDTIEYVLRDMTHAGGGFYSAEDADSEGKEGTFYVWTYKEIEQILGMEAKAFATYYGVISEGNFEHGNNVLYVHRPAAALPSMESLKKKLLAVRNRRIRPMRDEKVLTSWNGLMIGAMARAGDVLGEPHYTKAAEFAADFIWNTMRCDGKLLHAWRAGEAAVNAFLDDYAFLIRGFLDLYTATFDVRWIERALELQSRQNALFFDDQRHAYYDATEASDLIVRTVSEYDGAEPSGNSIAILNLLRLSVLTENDSFRVQAGHMLRYFAERIGKFPYAMPELVCAMIQYLQPPMQIVFAGKNIEELKFVSNERYLPLTMKVKAENTIGKFVETLSAADGTPTVYICQKYVCQLPIHDAAELEKQLESDAIQS